MSKAVKSKKWDVTTSDFLQFYNIAKIALHDIHSNNPPYTEDEEIGLMWQWIVKKCKTVIHTQIQKSVNEVLNEVEKEVIVKKPPNGVYQVTVNGNTYFINEGDRLDFFVKYLAEDQLQSLSTLRNKLKIKKEK